jgi:hypothetical protein
MLLVSLQIEPPTAGDQDAQQREIHFGERPVAAPASLLCDVRSADRKELSARGRYTTHLLRSGLLRRSLRKRVPASGQSRKSIMNVRFRKEHHRRSANDSSPQ